MSPLNLEEGIGWRQLASAHVVDCTCELRCNYMGVEAGLAMFLVHTVPLPAKPTRGYSAILIVQPSLWLRLAHHLFLKIPTSKG